MATGTPEYMDILLTAHPSVKIIQLILTTENAISLVYIKIDYLLA